MADSYPYTLSNNRLGDVLGKIKTAEKPDRFTNEFLKKLGFTSSNDRSVIRVFKALGFLSEDGSPTESYNRLKDDTDHAIALGESIKSLYSDLFEINTEIYKAEDKEIKGAFSRITGKSSHSVNRYFNTFKALCGLAELDTTDKQQTMKVEEKKEENDKDTRLKGRQKTVQPDFHYNIQVHLPATKDVSVYNAIFRSLKENLLD